MLNSNEVEHEAEQLLSYLRAEKGYRPQDALKVLNVTAFAILLSVGHVLDEADKVLAKQLADKSKN